MGDVGESLYELCKNYETGEDYIQRYEVVHETPKSLYISIRDVPNKDAQKLCVRVKKLQVGKRYYKSKMELIASHRKRTKGLMAVAKDTIDNCNNELAMLDELEAKQVTK